MPGATALVRPTVNTLPPVGLWLKFHGLYSLPYRFRLISVYVFIVHYALVRMSGRLCDRLQISPGVITSGIPAGVTASGTAALQQLLQIRQIQFSGRFDFRIGWNGIGSLRNLYRSMLGCAE